MCVCVCDGIKWLWDLTGDREYSWGCIWYDVCLCHLTGYESKLSERDVIIIVSFFTLTHIHISFISYVLLSFLSYNNNCKAHEMPHNLSLFFVI